MAEETKYRGWGMSQLPGKRNPTISHASASIPVAMTIESGPVKMEIKKLKETPQVIRSRHARPGPEGRVIMFNVVIRFV